MKRTFQNIFLINFYILFFAVINSCGTSSELIMKSSKNINKNEKSLVSSFSLNPTVIPLRVEKDTINNRLKRIYGNFQHPNNPVFSLQYDFGFTNYYNLGGGFDLSFLGGTIFLNNKIELTGFNQKDKYKKLRVSYYNKTSVSRGMPLIVANENNIRVAHFEMGNYFLIGLFIKNFELIIIPHLDFNHLISEKNIDVWDFKNNEKINGVIENHTLSYSNYGINLACRTKNNVLFEIGIQYLNTDKELDDIYSKSRYQFMFGIGYDFTKLLK